MLMEFDTNGDQALDLGELIVSWGGGADDQPIDPPADDMQPDDGPIGGGDDDGDGPVDDDLPIDEGDPIDGDPIDGGDDSPQTLARQELDNYDANGDGVLNRKELVAEFRDQGLTKAEAREEAKFMIREYDTNGDRALDFDELVASWTADEAFADEAFADEGFGDFANNFEDMPDIGGADNDMPGLHDGCDVNVDGTVSPIDALVLLNGLNDSGFGVGSPQFDLFDVNDDGVFSPLDALFVINRVHEQTNARLSAAAQSGDDDDEFWSNY